MADDVCLTMIQKAYKEKVDPSLVNEINSQLRGIFNNLRQKGELNRFEELANETLSQIKMTMARKRKERMQNILKTRQRFMDYYDNPDYEGDVVEAFKSLFSESQRGGIWGSSNSISHSYNSRLAKWGNIVDEALRENGADKIFASGAKDKELAEGLFNSRGTDFKPTGDSLVDKMVKTIRTVQKDMVAQLRRAGIEVGEILNYVMRQSHNAEKLMEAGFDKWQQIIRKHIDIEKSFGGNLSEDEIIKSLQRVFKEVTQGSRAREIGERPADQLITTRNYKKVGEDMTFSRSLHFKSGADFYEYNLAFGNETIFESLQRAMDNNARTVSLAERFGTDSRAAYEADKARVIAKLSKEGNEQELKRFKSATSSIDNLFEDAIGSVNVPANNMVAKAGKIARVWQDFTLLGKAVIFSTTELVHSAAQISSATGENILSVQGKFINNFFKNIPKENRASYAKMLQQQNDNFIGHFLSAISDEGFHVGKVAKNLEKKIYKMNLLAPFTDASRNGIAKTFSNILGENANKGFSELSETITYNFRRVGIGEDEWLVIREGLQDFPDGSKGITPEGILDLSNERITEILESVGSERLNQADITDEFFEDIKNELWLKYSNYLNDYSKLGSPTSNPRDRQAWLRGTRPGTPEGEVARFASQYKSYPLSVFRGLTRISQANPNKRYDIKALTQVMTAMTGAAYVSMALADIADNKTPRDPFDPKTMMEAFVRSASAGIYGDFLLGEYHKSYRNILESGMGPVAGDVVDVSEIVAKAIHGTPSERESIKKDLFYLFKNNSIPNLFYLRPALDHLFLDSVQESLSPNFKKNKMKRMRETPALGGGHQETIIGD